MIAVMTLTKPLLEDVATSRTIVRTLTKPRWIPLCELLDIVAYFRSLWAIADVGLALGDSWCLVPSGNGVCGVALPSRCCSLLRRGARRVSGPSAAPRRPLL